MKKKIYGICAAACLVLLLASFYRAGAHSAYQKGYGEGYAEAYQNGRMDGKANSESTCNATISGEFAASVLAVLPHADFPHLKPDTAVVAEFQGSGPFCVYVGEETAESLAVGGIYVFKVAEQRAEGVKFADALSQRPLDTPEAIYAHHLRIESVRPAEEGEYGTGSLYGLSLRWLHDEGIR